MFFRAKDVKLQNYILTGELDHGIYDSVALAQFRDQLGGNVKQINTSSLFNEDLSCYLDELKILLTLRVFQFYHIDELAGPLFITHHFEKRNDILGGPTPVIEFKLIAEF